MHLNKLPFHDVGIAGIIGPQPHPAKNNKRTKQSEKPKTKHNIKHFSERCNIEIEKTLTIFELPYFTTFKLEFNSLISKRHAIFETFKTVFP